MAKPSPDHPVIVPLENGPLKVTGQVTFKNSRGEAITAKRVMALCRCGSSKNKPFCDGTHASVGFKSEKSKERVPDQLDKYKGKEVTIHDNRGTCSHAGFCTSDLPSVWLSGTEPWIDPDGATRDEIVATVHKCPSGALLYEEKGEVQSKFHDGPEIRVSRDGPYYVRGGIGLESAELGEGATSEHYALCRCGASRNKPFCDGSHWYAGFHDLEELTISKANRAAAGEKEGWEALGKADDFEVGKTYSFTVAERPLALVRTEDGFHALDGRCPHQGGPLGEGNVCGDKLRCPWHGYDYDLKTGKGVGNDLQVETLEVREEGGRIEVSVPQPKRSNWTISHVIAETMVEWGVDTVFGMVGHSNLGMAEAIRVQEERGNMRYFGIRHEGAAAFAASGYAKISGKPAACLSIAGPGATNLLTGLWDAKVDRAPVLALTGQVNTQVLGPGAFQDIDLASAFEAVANFSQTVLPGSDHAALASLALKSAIIERNVSHLILPDEVQVLDAGNEGPGRPEGRVSGTAIAPPQQALDYSLSRIGRAKRPVIIVGYGARHDMLKVIDLAEALDCPVITTFKAKGQISDKHRLGAGVLGRSGTPVASWFMNQADLLIVFGASFSHHTGIDEHKAIIQVDFERMGLAKFHAVDEPVWGDIGTTATLFKEGLYEGSNRENQRAELAERWRQWRAEKEEREAKDNGEGINSAIVFRRLSESIPEDAIIAVDVGNNTYSFGRFFECQHQSVIMSGYLGSIGFGFPAAMGAWAAAKGARRVLSVSGDGGFGQYMGEFLTAVKYKMDIVHVLLNNSELGKISKEQRDGEWQVWQTGLHNPSFAEYARLCGGTGIYVDDPVELPKAFKKALKAYGPALVEIRTDPLLW
jgi:thiamine pyrophosphate-dependent acetolactate synthase large subunit-like protein/CDGSH-type Zn-finger protein